MAILSEHTRFMITIATSIFAFIPADVLSYECQSVANLKASETRDFILSPTFSAFTSNTVCEWHISTDSNLSVVMVDVTYFLMDKGQPNCTSANTYVEFFDGPNKDSPKIKKMCGNISHETFKSTSSDMTIVYHSDGEQSRNNTGFIFLYRAMMDDECPGIVNLLASGTGTYLYSPDFPRMPSNMDCEWHISSGSSSSMVVVEVNIFNLEETLPNCTNNYVEVYDGPSKDAPRIKLLCGKVLYGNFNSTNSELTIVFHSDRMKKKNSGFVFLYRAKQKTYGSIASCSNVSLVATEIPQYLPSPNYPSWYPSNTDCQWHISTKSDSRVVRLMFPEIILEQRQPECRHDYLKIYDGPSTDSKRKELLCGNNYNIRYQSTGSSLTIVFHSDGENNYKGFNLTYQSSKKNAGQHSRHNQTGLILKILGSVAAVLCFIIICICCCKRRIARRQLMKAQDKVSNLNADKVKVSSDLGEAGVFDPQTPTLYSSDLLGGKAEKK